MSTVRDAVFDFLRQVGARTFFGNPGSTELRMFRDWPEDFAYVLALQESVAVAAAAGHAMGTGRAPVVSLHSAGGVGHALGAVFNAYRDRVPLLVIAGQQSRAMLPTRPFLSADEPALFPRPYVKWSRQPERAGDVPAAVAEAYRMAMAPPRGPVFLSVPEDDWDAPAEPVAPREVRAGFVGDPEALRELADALDACEAPAIIVGPGVDDDGAVPAVVGLAERTGAAVWISPLSSRSGFPEDHPLFQGFLPPVRDQLARRLGHYDLVVAIGAPVFTYHVHTEGPFLARDTRLFHLDCDPAQAAWAPVGTSVLTTVRAGVTALLGIVEKADRPAPPPRPRPPAVLVPPASSSPRDAAGVSPHAARPMGAALVIETLRGLIRDDMVVVEEAPTHRDVLHERLPITRPGGYLTTGSGALGWGLPFAVGRALADTGERVVCVLGDGSAMYSIQALWTAARHRAPVTFVVLNNGGYEAVKQLGRRIGVPSIPGTDIDGLDIVAVAAGLGCPGARVTEARDLCGALAHALGQDGPYVVDVAVESDLSHAYEPR